MIARCIFLAECGPDYEINDTTNDCNKFWGFDQLLAKGGWHPDVAEAEWRILKDLRPIERKNPDRGSPSTRCFRFEDRRDAAIAVCRPLRGDLADAGRQIRIVGLGAWPMSLGAAAQAVVLYRAPHPERTGDQTHRMGTGRRRREPGRRGVGNGIRPGRPDDLRPGPPPYSPP